MLYDKSSDEDGEEVGGQSHHLPLQHQIEELKQFEVLRQERHSSKSSILQSGLKLKATDFIGTDSTLQVVVALPPPPLVHQATLVEAGNQFSH